MAAQVGGDEAAVATAAEEAVAKEAEEAVVAHAAAKEGLFPRHGRDEFVQDEPCARRMRGRGAELGRSILPAPPACKRSILTVY